MSIQIIYLPISPVELRPVDSIRRIFTDTTCRYMRNRALLSRSPYRNSGNRHFTGIADRSPVTVGIVESADYITTFSCRIVAQDDPVFQRCRHVIPYDKGIIRTDTIIITYTV